MALFGNTTEEKETSAAKKASAGLVASKKALVKKESPLATRILSRPRITEKSYALNALNQYVFVVTKKATKKTVQRAVEEAYAVNVTNVHIVHLPAKKRVFGKNKNVGSKSAVKKAIVSVAKGQSIELFKRG